MSYASERATVTVAPGVTPESVVALIKKVGYSAQLLPPPGTAAGGEEPDGAAGTEARIRELRAVRSTSTSPPT